MQCQRIISQVIFLFSGVFSTCAAQYVYYEGAGDQRAMLLPLCNYLGMMLVGLVPLKTDGKKRTKSSATAADTITIEIPTAVSTIKDDIPASPPNLNNRRQKSDFSSLDDNNDDDIIDPSSSLLLHSSDNPEVEIPIPTTTTNNNNNVDDDPAAKLWRSNSLTSYFADYTPLQLCILLNVFFDFCGCIFSNIGLSMAGSGIFQVVYSSVVCWSAIMSRVVLKRVTSCEEWVGIATVTFGLAFSALGESSNESHSYVVMLGVLNTLLGAGFYGATYVAGEYTLALPEKPEPKLLCVRIGRTCLGIIAVYMVLHVFPNWHELVTIPVNAASGSSTTIVVALACYTLSQLAHGLTYFMMLGSVGAVTTGVMQSLRAVLVFIFSSVFFCSRQESQCLDTKRGVATLVVVTGVLYYSWAKGQQQYVRRRKSNRNALTLSAGKNLVV